MKRRRLKPSIVCQPHASITLLRRLLNVLSDNSFTNGGTLVAKVHLIAGYRPNLSFL
jgi:hypothetical protein